MVEPDTLSVLGGHVPVSRTKRLLAGRGRYTADIEHARAFEIAFLRSPHAHARIIAIDLARARTMRGVTLVLTGADIAERCKGFAATSSLYPQMLAPVQHPLALEVARWHGEPVAMVVARTRGQAEDACMAIEIEWEILEPVLDPVSARAAPAIHPELGSNIALHIDQASDGAAGVMSGAERIGIDLSFNRHTGVPLETRSILADFDPDEERLEITMSHQCPHQMQVEFAGLLGLAQHRVRIKTPDVGGAFGIKQQLYGDELAACVAAMALGRPVRFIADRAEALLSDVQAREHRISAAVHLNKAGELKGFSLSDIHAIGPYLQYPRSNLGESRALLSLAGAPYRFDAFSASVDIVFQNKGMCGHYRGVGHPLVCTMTEALMDAAARAIGKDPVAFRRQHLVEEFPYKAPTGTIYERLAFTQCFDALETKVNLDAIRGEVALARDTGRVMGWGIAAFVEQTARGPGFYGQGGQAVSSRDGAIVRLEPSGTIRCLSSITEQGQGAETGVRQLVARALGVSLNNVEMVTGDTAVSPHGGGTWGSRAMAIGGQAAWNAAQQLRAELLRLSGILSQEEPDALDIENGKVVGKADGLIRVSLAQLAHAAHFRPYAFGTERQPQLTATAEYGPLTQPFRCGTGIQLSQVEIDQQTGQLTLLRHIVVHEAGRVVNPLLVDEQIRGGVAQGLGGFLFEHCAYDAEGKALATSLAQYRVPQAIDLPDIELIHADNPPFTDDGLGIVGVGEAGTVGAGAALLNAVNDALIAAGGKPIYDLPLTPPRLLRALGAL